MPHAGLVTIILGVTVATVLYFMFGNNKQRNDQYYEHGYESYPEQSSMSRDSDECPICLLPLAYKINYILQPCRHKFHKRCIEKWGHEAESQALCPLCRSPFAQIR
ncbi:E3 ubiquitin-protein ligase RNF181-like [Apis laboriosa]|uniref:E3 ubiquitin-protein ligase RNF181 n=2 Tax=Apis TaxID=7459 RepID=A0A7M7GJS9_APIME|nr:E3 ubiquitin-protein ligase RNF181 [Apis mellifera]XP_006558354.1 E3 ubiquitin-protein ligase RNF181 [Apis mellifera]XP_006609093.1 E3 ubiquitin-protein ligase RNF181-like isoform X1 [Apis dorsata]XP_006609094.1 E3 ubiquitin-protein ligase RNF181-like isoform X1 [Apis dorsata]XP_043790633.1 E3 ubiquitin-protein ligase RNF181-like [Apis laboriosa]KAG6795278.1 E3 ubiquitin-protein ligase [Apis mellifera caucasica]KAG9428700.1 E3 ubiquitin-protein ligase [Apis mellifera carnica]PBC30244.1 RI|eukprot:XP_001120409.1 E3 ubiquitin-protein ligase RNF181 [Apis mellifera]